jgi:hypothetical protein
MIRSITAVALAIGLVVPLVTPSVAHAASVHRHKRYSVHPARDRSSAPVQLYGGRRAYSVYRGQIDQRWYTGGPRWASPNQCFEDLGYGRYESCDW